MKYISLLGSTGSIGQQTLEIVRERKDIEVTALAAKSSIQLLEQQAREFSPSLVCVYEESGAAALREKLRDTNITVCSGLDGLVMCALSQNASIVVTALVGMIGLRPTIEAIKAGKDIALANKETLVTAGHIIMPLAKEHNVRILPVDSEHSAIFQSLQGNVDYFSGENKDKIERIILTASGGPFRGMGKADLRDKTVEDALKHPNWSMGKKITIDSATMVNKGLEVIEAAWLFDVVKEQIQVVVHPQSILHSAVEFVDGSVIAQLGMPDMKLPIQYALYYPDRHPLNGTRLNLFELGKMTFEMPDMDTFSGLRLAYEALETGGSMPTVYNAANEFAVAKFLNNEIPFLIISEFIEAAMQAHQKIDNPDVSLILEAELETYEFIERECQKQKGN